MAKTAKVAIPRLAAIEAPTEAEILFSRAPTDDRGEPLALFSYDAAGVCVFFGLGLVYFPAIDSQGVEVTKGVAKWIAPLLFPGVGIEGMIHRIHFGHMLDEVLSTEELEIPEFLQRTLQHRRHFFVPFIELVEATAYYDTGLLSDFFGDRSRLDLIRETADGQRTTQRVEVDHPQTVLTPLMLLRLRAEIYALLKRFSLSNGDEVEPGIRQEYRARYGDEWKKHVPDAEIARVIRRALQPILPHYAKLPEMVEYYGWLFLPVGEQAP